MLKKNDAGGRRGDHYRPGDWRLFVRRTVNWMLVALIPVLAGYGIAQV